MAGAKIENQQSKVCYPENLKAVFENTKLPPCAETSSPQMTPSPSITKGYSSEEIAKVQKLLNQTVAVDEPLVADGQGGRSSKTETAMDKFTKLYNIDHPKAKIDPTDKAAFIEALSSAVGRGAYKPKAEE